MNNRLGKILREDKDEDQGGRQMAEIKKDFTIQDFQEELTLSDGYMLGVTFLKKGMLTTHLLTNNFPTGDIEKAVQDFVALALPDSEVTIKRVIKISENKNEPNKQ